MKKKAINRPQMPETLKQVMFAVLFFSAWSVPNANAEQLPNENRTENEQILQDKKIAVHGTVTDASGEALIGVSVSVKGSTSGTVTDVDGNFNLSVPSSNSTLTFSYIGYAAQDVAVGSKTSFNVVMKDDSKMLDQVVVTALGMKRTEKSLGYSVTEVKGDNLDANVINPVSALQGKVAGLDISNTDGGLFGSAKVQIRGASTLKGNNQPIYVVDGVILDNDIHESSADWDSNSKDFGNQLKNLNPDDFESVSVLKGAPATALYGSRGLNGAIVITTKGGGKQKGFGVSVNQTFGIDVVTQTPDRQNKYGIGALAGYVNYGSKNSDGTFRRWDTNQLPLVGDTDTPTLIGGESMYWGPAYDGRSIQLYDRTMGSYSPTKNAYRDAYKTGFNTNTNVIIKGGNDIISFYSSLSYKYAEGTIDRNSFDRFSYLLKGSYKISKRVDVTGSVTFATSNPRNPSVNIGTSYISGSLGPLYNTDYYRYKYKGTHGGLADNKYGDKYGDVPGGSLWWNIDESTLSQKEYTVRPTLDVNVKIADWVNFKAEGNMNYYHSNQEEKTLGQGYLNEGKDNETGGFYSFIKNENRQETLAGTFTFNKSLNDFSLGGFIRGEYFNMEASKLGAKTDGGLIIPGQYFLGNSRNPLKVDSGLEDPENKVSIKKRILSAVFAANLGWKDQLYLDITGRNDWSSALVYSNGTGNYSYFYPSVTASWIATETLKNLLPSWVSFAKMRASWAQVGNDTNPYYINSGFSLDKYLQSDGTSIYVDNASKIIKPTDLKPERKNAWEFGLDWRFVNNRFGVDFTYYKENTKNQIMEIALNPLTGANSQLVNAGNIQNQGVELAIHTTPFVNKDWEWTVDLTYTKNESKIVKLHPNVQNYIVLDGDVNYGNFRVGSVAKVGGEYGVLMSDSSPLKDKNGNILLMYSDNNRYARQIRSGEATELGSINPDFLGSISTGLKYKNFTLKVLMDMRFGGLIASYSNKYGTAYGITESSMKYRDKANGGITWVSQYADSKGMEFHDGVIPEGVFQDGTVVTTPTGDKVNISGMSYADAVTKGYVEPVHASAWTYFQNQWGTGIANSDWINKVKYIALREISIGYRVPQSFASKLGAQGMNLALSGRNLGYLYNSLPNHINPESVRSNKSGAFRERGFLPVTSSFMFTIGLDF